jgi:thioredoxin 1
MHEVTDSTFEKDVLKSDKTVVVDFWAEWCGPCKMMGPIFESISKEISDAKFVKLNVDESQDTAQAYGVQSIPTFIVFKKGKEVDRIVGGLPKPMFKAKLEASLRK